MSEKSHELLTKILWAVPERSRDEIEEIVGDDFVKWAKKTSSDLPTLDEKDETHQTMMEIEHLLILSGCRTWRNLLLTFWPSRFGTPREQTYFRFEMQRNFLQGIA